MPEVVINCVEIHGVDFIAKVLDVAVRVNGMTETPNQKGELSREQLYRSFSANGNPTLKTALVVIKASGIELTAKGGRRHDPRSMRQPIEETLESLPMRGHSSAFWRKVKLAK